MSARALGFGIAAMLACAAACSKPEVKTPEADASADASADVQMPPDAPPEIDASVEAEAPARPSPSATATTTTTKQDASASLETAGTDAGAKKAGPLNLDEGSDGKTFDVATGQSIVLMLTASPTSGFDWSVTKAPPALGAPEMGFISGGDAMGASGKRRITFTVKSALPPGEHTVELGYRRSFEKGVPAFKTFKFKVHGVR